MAMEETQVSVIRYLFKKEYEALGEAITKVNFEKSHVCSSLEEAKGLFTDAPDNLGFLILASLEEKKDLVQIASLLKLFKSEFKQIVFKIVLINYSRNQNFEKAAQKLGIQDFLETNHKLKALKFKLEYYFKSISAKLKLNLKNKKHEDEKLSQGKNAKSLDQSNSNNIKWISSLEVTDDIWLINSENEIKFLFSKWIIKLRGPGPAAGIWVDTDNNTWKYEFKGAYKEKFIKEEGDWYFTGEQKPEFSFLENMWMLKGRSFELFYKKNEEKFSRVLADKKNLEICRNSQFALDKNEIIEESLDNEVSFKKETDRLEDLEGEGNTDNIEKYYKGDLEENENSLRGMKGQFKKEDGEDRQSSKRKNKLSPPQKDYSIDPEKLKKADFLGVDQDNFYDKYLRNHNKAKQYEAKEFGKKKKSAEDSSDGDKDQSSSTGENKNEESELILPPEENIKNEIMNNDLKSYEEFKIICYMDNGFGKVECQLYDFFDEFIIYLMEEKIFDESIEVCVEMIFQFKDNSETLSLKGMIDSIERHDVSYVLVKIEKNYIEEFEKLLNHFEALQERISSFLMMGREVA